MYDFLTFRRMLTPIVIQIVCWVGILASIALGVFAILVGTGQGGDMLQGVDIPAEAKGWAQAGGVFVGCGTMVVGPILVRLVCEQLMLFHRINETLSDLRDLQRRTLELAEVGRGPAVAAPVARPRG